MRADDLLAYLRSARSNVAATDRYWCGRGPEGSGPCSVNPQAPREVARRSVKWRGQDSNLRTQRGCVYSAVRLTTSLPRRAAASVTNGRPLSTSYSAYLGPPRRIGVAALPAWIHRGDARRPRVK